MCNGRNILFLKQRWFGMEALKNISKFVWTFPKKKGVSVASMGGCVTDEDAGEFFMLKAYIGGVQPMKS